MKRALRSLPAYRAQRDVGFALAVALFATSAVARPPPSEPEADRKSECLDTHVQAQREQRAGRLLEARRLLLDCMRPGCGDVLRQDCIRLLSEVQSAVATIRLTAVDGLGRPVELARAWIDGVDHPLRAEESIVVDPGEHEIVGLGARGERGSAVVAIVAGARRTEVVLRLDAKPDAPSPSLGESLAEIPRGATSPEGANAAPTEHQPPPPRAASPRAASAAVDAPGPVATAPTDPGATARAWSYGIGALGLASLGAFAVLGGLGLSAQADLEDGCAPYCSIDEVRHMDRLYTAADVCLAVSVTSLVSAAVLFFTAPDETEPDGVGFGRPLTAGWRF